MVKNHQMMRVKMENPKSFTIVISGDESGAITVHDSKTDQVSKWDGIMLIFGDVEKSASAHFSWGSYQSIIYGMYGSIMDARTDKSKIGEHNRTILGMVSRMIIDLYDFFHKARCFGLESVLVEWEEESEVVTVKDDKAFH